MPSRVEIFDECSEPRTRFRTFKLRVETGWRELFCSHTDEILTKLQQETAAGD